MTTHYTFSRSLAVLSAFVTLAIGISLIIAPSKARAETLKDFDKGSMTFREIVGDVQNGNQFVITAQVTVPGTAGKPRTGSVTFSAYMEYSEDGSFMDYTDDTCVQSQLTRQAGADACAAISGALHAGSLSPETAPGPVITGPATPEEGIIMRDGGVCDPIRHMGC